ncbi:MAG: type II secretion system F family protein [Deltaproteobacteria bacterium]|nr:type II secretion system F family protein [Deltaproteobacteria bacterium]
MPIYVWEGINAAGEKTKGELNAVDGATAKAMLQKKRINVTKLKPKPKDLSEYIPFLAPKVKQTDVVIFTRQMSTLIDSGLPLIQGLDALARQQENPKFAEILTQIKTDVETGSTFAEALKKHPKLFDRLYTNMVAAGEMGGVLDSVMARLAAYMEKAQRLKRKVKGAMTYPAIVLGISIGVLSIILIFVIPVFEKMFKEFGHALPAPTQMVIDVSNFVKSYILLILLLLGGLVFLFKKYYSTEKGRTQVDRLLLRAPIFGPLLRKVAVAKLTRTLGTLIVSGVPIIEALNVAAGTAGNKIVENAIIKVKTSVTEGKTIAQPLEESGIFPAMVIQMISVGETSGALDKMLTKVADFYDEEVDTAVDALTSMIEPLMIVFLGGTIGTIIIAMYLPIFKMAGAVSG